MKTKLLFMTLFILIQHQLMATEITVCSGDSATGTALSCVGDYRKNGTNLVALYKHGWRLVFIDSLSSRSFYYFYLEK